MVMGRDAILTFWKTAAEQIGDIKLTAVDVKPLGDNAAREIGTFSLRTKGAQPHQVTGKYVVVWENIGGEWKLATDIWNTNK
jgi:ketosteroid isomerase-like protein